jgi:hypothetical protein
MHNTLLTFKILKAFFISSVCSSPFLFSVSALISSYIRKRLHQPKKNTNKISAGKSESMSQLLNHRAKYDVNLVKAIFIPVHVTKAQGGAEV